MRTTLPSNIIEMLDVTYSNRLVGRVYDKMALQLARNLFAFGFVEIAGHYSSPGHLVGSHRYDDEVCTHGCGISGVLLGSAAELQSLQQNSPTLWTRMGREINRILERVA